MHIEMMAASRCHEESWQLVIRVHLHKAQHLPAATQKAMARRVANLACASAAGVLVTLHQSIDTHPYQRDNALHSAGLWLQKRCFAI